MLVEKWAFFTLTWKGGSAINIELSETLNIERNSEQYPTTRDKNG